MSREEMIEFIRSAAKEVEGVHLPFSYFLQFTDEQLDRECDWYEYLLTK